MAGWHKATLQADISVDQTYKMIVGRAVNGLERAAQFTLGRAKYHAPVRAIFNRTRRGRPAPKGRNVPGWETKGWRYIRTQQQYDRVMASREPRTGMTLGGVPGAARYSGEQAGGYMVHKTRTQKMKDAAGNTVWVDSEHRKLRAGIGGMGTRFSGHSNTLFPVFKTAKGERITGDFRSVKPINEVISQKRGKGRANLVTGKQVATYQKTINAMLSSAGKAEIRSRRAMYDDKIGGRLRGEIRVVGPEIERNTVWFYVESPTYYAVHQEFGTKRSRAHPYLRPALYESRNVLRQQVRMAVERPSGNAIYRTDSRTSSRKREMN